MSEEQKARANQLKVQGWAATSYPSNYAGMRWWIIKPDGEASHYEYDGDARAITTYSSEEDAWIAVLERESDSSR